ncbi:protein RTF2 [Tripterygium wilfordii]|uniref:Protein RTF2 n=1 Tax=Tripterygium wilfordii TaxID=458696 RepID=A0A7J7DTR6_TRIWF|nr:replication termination factor 2 [Tripterygium wilfordii]KAF5749526.1 protein RTF2 [Tripterygium wilfordii]
MHSRKTQLFLQSPNFETLTLNLDSSNPQTLSNLKLSILSDRRHSLSSFYFTLDGKALSDSTPIPNSRIAPLSTLVLSCRLSGGGGDGGATGAESRDCYLNMYAEKKPDKVDPNEQRLSKWLNCGLSNEPLTEPCVIDRLGNIFNKQALVEALLGKKLPKEFGYIKGLKDMINIKLSPIPSEVGERSDTRFQCPITGLEFNGKYKFFALRNCGHVLSAKALKEVKSSSCLVCHEEFKDSDRMVINGSDEEVAALRERMEEERAKIRDKKTKKVKNGNVVSVSVTGEEVDLVLDSSQMSGAKRRVDDKGVVKVSGKVEVNGKVENGGVTVKGSTNGPVVKKFKAAAPPNANKEVYASIFTSSRKSEFKETYSCRSLPLGRN